MFSVFCVVCVVFAGCVDSFSVVVLSDVLASADKLSSCIEASASSVLVRRPSSVRVKAVAVLQTGCAISIRLFFCDVHLKGDVTGV